MKYISSILFVMMMVSICHAEIWDSGIPKGDYSDASLHRQYKLSLQNQQYEPRNIEIDTETNRVVD